MNQKRPVNLDLRTIKFPPMAIASILHRISGVVLFLLIPFLLYFVDLSLKDQQSFLQAKDVLSNPIGKVVIWALGAAFIYHFLAGIRHLLMDAGYGEHLCAGRRTAITVIVLSVLLSILLGIWLW